MFGKGLPKFFKCLCSRQVQVLFVSVAMIVKLKEQKHVKKLNGQYSQFFACLFEPLSSYSDKQLPLVLMETALQHQIPYLWIEGSSNSGSEEV